MREYISEGRAVYEDENHGLFSRRLAEWAIGNMKVKEPGMKEARPLKGPAISDVKRVLEESKIVLPDEFLYTAWYLYAMALADYPKTLTTDRQRALFIEETLCDADGYPENVLACFEAKMREAEVPIFWEEYL